MNDIELIDTINRVTREAVNEAFNELGVSNRIKTDGPSAYKKTEQLLWNYENIKRLITDKEEQIQEVLEHGLRTKAKDISEYHSAGGTVQEVATVQETVQGVVDGIQHDILWVRQCLERVELALDIVRGDESYPILEAYYFGNVPLADIALEYESTPPAIARRRNALVRRVALHLFPQDAISEMLE